MHVVLRVIDHELYLEQGGNLYPLGLADVKHEEKGGSITILNLITFLYHLDESLLEALGPREYERVMSDEDERELNRKIKESCEYRTLEKMWEASNGRRMPEP